MRQLRPIEKFLIILLLVVFGGIVLHAPLTVIASVTVPHFTDLVKSWKEILLGVALIVAVSIAIQKHDLRRIFADRLVQLTLVYVALHLILLLPFWQGMNASLAGLLIDLRYILFFVLVYIVAGWYPQLRRLFIVVGLWGALIVVGFALLQVFILPADILRVLGYSNQTIAAYLTVDQNQAYVRINSTLRGPNPLGAYALIVLTVIVAAWVKGQIPWKKLSRHAATRWKYWLTIGVVTIGSIIALWHSYSRSAVIAAVVAVGIVIAATVARRLNRTAWITVSVAVCALVGAVLLSWNTPFVKQVVLHENPTGGSAVSSNDGHAESLVTGFDRMIQQPLGAGVGSTGSASLYGNAPIIIENQYLLIAHEVGWIGVALFLVLFCMVLYMLWMRRKDWLALGLCASGIGLAMIGILLPVWVDDTVSIVWWGVAAIALARQKY